MYCCIQASKVNSHTQSRSGEYNADSPILHAVHDYFLVVVWGVGLKLTLFPQHQEDSNLHTSAHRENERIGVSINSANGSRQ